MSTRRTETDLPHIENLRQSRESSKEPTELEEDELRGSQSQRDESLIELDLDQPEGPEVSPDAHQANVPSDSSAVKRRGRPPGLKAQTASTVTLGAPTKEGFATLLMKESVRGPARVHTEAINSIALRSDKMAAAVAAHESRLAAVVETPADTQRAMEELRAGLSALHGELQAERRRALEAETTLTRGAPVPDGVQSKLDVQHAYLQKLGIASNNLTRKVAAAEEVQRNLTTRCAGLDSRIKSLEAARDALPDLDVHRGSSSHRKRSISPAADPGPSDRTKRQKQDTAGGSTMPALSFGPWTGWMSGTAQSAIGMALRLLVGLPDMSSVASPIAAEVAVNKAYVFVYWEEERSRNMYGDAWMKCRPVEKKDIVAVRVQRQRPPAEAFSAVNEKSNRPGQRQLLVLSWNVNGSLELKLQIPRFVRFLAAHDVVLLQETHLIPEEEQRLPWPQGYEVYSNPREAPSEGKQQWGGVLALVRSELASTWRSELSSPDVMVLQVEDVLLGNFYLPPSSSPAIRLSVGPHAVSRASAAVSQCVTLVGLPFVVVMDANGRTSSRQGDDWAAARLSEDTSSDSRGRELLQLLRLNGMAILNGLSAFPGSGCLTSRQSVGSSVIDYVAATQDGAARVARLSVSELPDRDSDHARITFSLAVCKRDIPGPSAQAFLPRIELSDDLGRGQPSLDLMLSRALEVRLNSDDRLLCLYGSPRSERESMPITVYTDGSCTGTGTVHAAAGSGIVWGLGSPKNAAFRVPGPQTSARAELFAVYKALIAAPSDRVLVIHTDSQYVIRTLCHWAGDHCDSGWRCTNADLVMNCVVVLRSRPNATRFVWVKGHSGNVLNDTADALAATGRHLPVCNSLPAQADVTFDIRLLGSGQCKVQTLLPRVPDVQAVEAQTVLGHPTEDQPLDVRELGRRERDVVAQRNLDALESVRNEKDFWRFVYHVSHPRSRMAAVSMDALRSAFQERMNAPLVPPPDFDTERMNAARQEASALPECTLDISANDALSRQFSVDDVALLKDRIRSKGLGKSLGSDMLSYTDLLEVPNDVLAELFNACLHLRNVPTNWTVTFLVALLKARKDAHSADSYRAVGLESCLLKMFSMLVDMRLREWVDARRLLPATQNGFRPGFRTNNNVFILRCASDRARASGRVLYTASVDISNAFPSVSHDVLWPKLHDLGLRGPVLDTYRKVYERMVYVLRGDDNARAFTSDMGILIGDPASPIMWLLFFFDLDVPASSDDVELGGVRISHLEQADDIIFFALSPAALQAKLDAFFKWCGGVFLQINHLKSWWMPLGCSPRPGATPHFTLGSRVVPLREQESYVGMRLSSQKRNPLASHYTHKATAASCLKNLFFSIVSKTCIRCPPQMAKRWYMGVLDPHLTHGADVMPDTGEGLKLLQMVQRSFIRLLLDVDQHAPNFALFAVTGIWPLEYRRADLLVRFLGYALQRPRDELVAAALRDSMVLHEDGRECWYGDVHRACARLPVGVSLGNIVDSQDIDAVRIRLRQAMESDIAGMGRKSEKLLLLRHLPADRTSSDAPLITAPALAFREFLKLKIPDHRTAVIKLLFCSHGLLVERGRWVGTARSDRLCRFCQSAVEDECHALFGCTADGLICGYRLRFWADLMAASANLCRDTVRMRHDKMRMIGSLCVNRIALPIFARFVHRVLKRYAECP